MKFPHPLVEGRLLRRYKRFLADIELPDGETITAHTANTGTMLGCCSPGSRVWLSVSDNPKRKYAHTWELVEAVPGVLCGINTLLSNKLVHEAIADGVIPQLRDYAKIRSEVRYGKENSRIDLLLEPVPEERRPACYVEVKNVTLVENEVAYFPDAVSARGSRHLRELMHMVEAGQRAVILFCVQRGDCRELRPADAIDPVYGETLRQAIEAGVEAMAWQAQVTTAGIRLARALTVSCP